MKSVKIHAIVLATVLLAAYVTWNRESRPDNPEASTVVWRRRPADLRAVVYQSNTRTLELERRTTNNRPHLWATETTQPLPAAARADTAARPAGAHDAHDAHTAPASPQNAATLATRMEEFPLGAAGDALFEKLATLRVVRDLGRADSARQAMYGLTGSESKLTLQFQDQSQRVLTVGNTVVGGSDRYALDTDAQRIYVLSYDLVRPIDTASDLRLTDYQDFQANDVAAVTVRAGANERRMERRAGQPVMWTPPGSTEADQAFTSFMEQLNQLWVSRYAPALSVDSLETIVRVEFLDDDGDSLGLLELFRTRGESRTYYMRTRRTIVPAEVYAPLGERIEQDAATLFRNRSTAGTD